jgi:HD superfamily phosphohydrolase
MARVDEYKAQVEEFARASLEPYIAAIADPTWRCPSAKELNDCVWQTVVLRPFEVIILDSPLLQRLRYVRQLGVAHWTYPGAAHSRFEHSVGAVHQIDRLLESLQQRNLASSNETLPPVPEKKIVNTLRFAALCHDMGHGAMSHVVENAFKRLGTIADLTIDLSDALGVEEAKLSEAAAYYLIGSATFERLIEIAREKTRHELPENVSTLLRHAILGRPIHDRYPLLQELINGPFDADKLDYITRDAHMAGVPVVTDIPRLVQKVRAVEIGKTRLPPAVSKKVSGDHDSYVLYGVALSGGRTLDELMFGRTLLFDKIYRHQKVRSAEAMVASIIEQVARVAGDRAPLLPLLFEDDDLLDLTREGLDARFRKRLTEEEWKLLAPAREIAGRLKARRLFVRAFAFSQSMTLDPFRLDDEQRRGFERLLRDSPKPERRQLLVQKLADELLRMRSLVPEAWPDKFGGSLTSYIALDAPDSFGHPKEIARAYLVTDDRQVVPFREDSAESPAWSAAYLMTRDLGYIFTPPELSLATFLAAELVFRREYGIRTPKSAQDYAKIRAEPLDKLRRALSEKGFYDGLPNDLRAEPERLRKADIEGRIAAVVQRLGTYEGLAPATSSGHPKTVRVEPPRIRTWLRQFHTDAEVEAALGWLEATRIVSRHDVHEALLTFMGANEPFKGAWVCPFGSPKDSSAIVTYYVNDLGPTYELRPATLAEALGAGDSKPILFVDDFISSGGQARTIVCNWMADEGAPLDEEHGAPLSPNMREELKGRQVAFLFVAGDQDGVTALVAESTRVGLRATGSVHIAASNLPKAFGAAGGEPVRDRAREIGRQLLKTTQSAKTDEWIAERSLGYGNNGYLLVFPYNTPTQTLTLLWSEGTVDGWRWLPIFPRRAKR